LNSEAQAVGLVAHSVCGCRRRMGVHREIAPTWGDAGPEQASDVGASDVGGAQPARKTNRRKITPV